MLNYMGIIEVKGVSKSFGYNLILDNVFLSVPENKIFGIIGVNGSGKTTLLRLLVGFYKPDSGQILYKNQDIRKVMKDVKRDFGFTTQESSFYPKLTVEENIRYFGSLYGLSRVDIDKNIERVIPLVELQNDRKTIAENLSGGMQRRLDMACSLIHIPKVLILDEPTEDLDPLLRHDIIRLIRRINLLNTTVIITSHILDDVEHLCDEVAILHNKKVIKVGTVEELREIYHKKEEIHLETLSGNYDEIVRRLKIEQFLIVESKLIIYTDEAEKILREILDVIEKTRDKILYVDMKKPSLVEVFERLTGKTGKWQANY